MIGACKEDVVKKILFNSLRISLLPRADKRDSNLEFKNKVTE